MTQLRKTPSADRLPDSIESQLHVALDNMPGALVYTDEDLKIVFCNERFKEMYPAPRELLQSGRPYPDFLRFLAENGYYGAGDVDALVAQRVESSAESDRQKLRRPHAGRPMLSDPPASRVNGRHDHRDD